MRFSQSTHLQMCLSLETLMSFIGTGKPILVELIDLVNYVIIFWSHMILLWWLTSLLGSQTMTLTGPALLDLFISSNTSICSTMAFSPLGNSDHVVVSVSIDFPTNSKQDATFHRITYDYSCADWDVLRDHLRDVPWEDIFKLSASTLLVNFVSGFRLEFMYISLVSIRSNLTHLHRFQQLVLLS